ncbi:MAG: bifunctional ornithine acetyltransferase/N-acetylglutamate synthase, partial [Verrucomicrobiota bacterium]
DAFQSALNEVTQNLAKQIVRDGERVTKFVEVQVSGAANDSDAQLVAQAVANSNLVKSSWNGNDPNWGRIIHAVGYAGAEVVPDRIDISFNDLPAAIGGMTAKEAKLEDLVAAVTKPEFQIQIRLGMGDGTGLVYASDLSPEYVDFNRAEYAATLAKKRQEG